MPESVPVPENPSPTSPSAADPDAGADPTAGADPGGAADADDPARAGARVGDGVPTGVHTLDPRSLRGLAHPLRMRLLVALREDGPATASQLASRLGESSGATSYHLRQLGAHGFVEEDPERGTARERWWRARYRSVRMDRGELLSHPDPEVRGAVDLLVREMAAGHAEEVDGWLHAMPDWPEPWRAAWDMSDFSLRLTPERAHELSQKLHEVIEGYRDAPEEPGDGEAARAATGKGSGAADEPAQSFRVHLHAFPRATRPSDDQGKD